MGCFADDTAFWCIPSNISKIKYKLLQNELNRFTDWTKYWKMSINPTKCFFISIHKPSFISLINKNYKIDHIPIEQANNCKYLGLWIDKHLTLKTHIAKNKNKLEQHLNHLYFMQNSGIELYPKTILQIYKSKSRPCIEYASIYYFHKDKKHKIQTIQNKFIRAAYPCKKSTPISTLEMIANIKPISLRVKQLILRHWFRAHYLSSFHPLNKP